MAGLIQTVDSGRLYLNYAHRMIVTAIIALYLRKETPNDVNLGRFEIGEIILASHKHTMWASKRLMGLILNCLRGVYCERVISRALVY
jgi:hypothetical protein